MVIIIRFFSICVISLFLLASCPPPCFDFCHAQISSTRSTGPTKLRIENFVTFGRFKFQVSGFKISFADIASTWHSKQAYSALALRNVQV